MEGKVILQVSLIFSVVCVCVHEIKAEAAYLERRDQQGYNEGINSNVQLYI